jgi:hypothetical protein
LESSSAPVEETITFSSISTSTPGMPATSEPVAMTMFFASISWVLAVVAGHRHLALAEHLAGADEASILFFFIRKATPSTFDFTTVASLCAIIAFEIELRLADLDAHLPAVCSASANISEACSSALDGMQPIFRQVPPSVARFSTIGGLQAELRALMAQT